MLGAIAGDMIGSHHEYIRTKRTDFPLWSVLSNFTDDSILTIATAEALLHGEDFGTAYHRWGRRYPDPVGAYGGMFKRWLASDQPAPYNSFGNGSAMRVSPVAWWGKDEAEVLALAEATAMPTHNHPRGIIGAQATALAIWLARQGASREVIRQRVADLSGYDMDRTAESIRPDYEFDVTCDGSVPEAIICALDSTDWEHAVRLAISLGGDADTQAAIAGGIAEAMYGGLSAVVQRTVLERLPDEMLEVVRAWQAVSR